MTQLNRALKRYVCKLVFGCSVEIVRSSIVSCRVLFVRFYRWSFHLFVYTDDCGLCCKSSTESFRIIIFWRNIEMADFDVLEEIYKNVLTCPLCKNYTRDWFIYCNYDLTLFFPRYDLAITKYHSGSDINVALNHENEVRTFDVFIKELSCLMNVRNSLRQ